MAPSQPLMLVISLLEPMIAAVPESTIASQLAEHATVFPLMVMLQHEGRINGLASITYCTLYEDLRLMTLVK